MSLMLKTKPYYKSQSKKRHDLPMQHASSFITGPKEVK